MNHDYSDIRERTVEVPKWFDEYAVPRYCDFAPKYRANIYADECALVLVACQSCEHEFEVAFSKSRSDLAEIFRGNPYVPLWKRIENKELSYGDPPNIGCCSAGPTMSSDAIRVLQYWSRLNTSHEWRRESRFEIALGDCCEICGAEEGEHAIGCSERVA